MVRACLRKKSILERALSTRRRLLSGPGVALALAGAGCGGAGRSSQRLSALPPVPRSHDVAILNSALDHEYELIAAYTASIPLLAEPGRLAAEQFLGQHLAHAGELAGWIEHARATASKPLSAYRLSRPRTSAGMLSALLSLENAMIASYLAAIPELAPGKLRANTASILANEAQHVAVLRSVLGRQPVASALVTGRQ